MTLNNDRLHTSTSMHETPTMQLTFNHHSHDLEIEFEAEALGALRHRRRRCPTCSYMNWLIHNPIGCPINPISSCSWCVHGHRCVRCGQCASCGRRPGEFRRSPGM